MKYEVKVECQATLEETWHVEIPHGMTPQEADDYAMEHLAEGEFIEQASDNEHDRKLIGCEAVEELAA